MDFKFYAEIAKAEEVNGKYVVSGVAATTDLDKQNEVMSAKSIKEMAHSALGLPLVTSHNHEFTDEIGTITFAEVDELNRLVIKSELDAEDPNAMRVYRKIKSGKSKVGFSIGGSIRNIGKSTDRNVRVIDSVDLKHVMITSKPVNPYTFALAINKAISGEALMDEKELTKAEDQAPEVKVEVNEAPAQEPKVDVSVNEAPQAPAADPLEKPAEDAKLSKAQKNADLIAKAVSEALAPIKTELVAVREELSKSGARLSATTIATLRDIHNDAAATEPIKSKIRGLVGNDINVLNVAQPEDVIGGPVEDAAPVAKSITEEFAELKKSIVDEIKSEITNVVKPQPLGVADLFKSQETLSNLDDDSLKGVLRKLVG